MVLVNTVLGGLSVCGELNGKKTRDSNIKDVICASPRK